MARWAACSSTRSTSAPPRRRRSASSASTTSVRAADPAFTGAVVNNLVYAAGTAVPSIGLALLFALALSRTNAVTSALRAALFLPALIPMVAASALFLSISLPNVGLLDHYIGRPAAGGAELARRPRYRTYAIMVITVWKNAGYYMLLFLAGLQAVPEDVTEAAHLDGAGPFHAPALHHPARVASPPSCSSPSSPFSRR